MGLSDPMTSLAVVLPLATIAGMLAYVLQRRWRRSRWLRKRDRLRRRWLERLPQLVAGASLAPGELATRDEREVLERLLIDRLAVATVDEVLPLRSVLEREGFIDRHLDWLRRGGFWQKLESAALLGITRAKTAVPILAQLLRHRSAEMREAAARALAMIGDVSAGSSLLEEVRQQKLAIHPTTWLRAVVCCQVPANDLLQLLADSRANVRAMVARALAEMPQPVQYGQVERYVFDPEPEVRAQMARLLGRTADARAAEPLTGLARDVDWVVRSYAQTALGQLGRPECVDAVFQGTLDSVFEVRSRATEALARLSIEPKAVLTFLMETRDAQVLHQYISLIERSGMLWRMLSMLCDPQQSTRESTATLLAMAIDAGVTHPFVYALTDHPNRRVRLRVARLLADSGAPALISQIADITGRIRIPRERRAVQAAIGRLTKISRLAPTSRPKIHALADRV